MQALLDTIQSLFDHYQDIPSARVSFSPQVREMCAQNKCGSYGKSWTCPPALNPIEELQARLAPYDRFMLFDRVYSVKSNLDWDGMMDAGREFQTRVNKLRKRLHKLAPDFDFQILGAGHCQLCQPCTYQDKEPCRHPQEAVYSLEAYGIDVVQAMKQAGLKYYNGKNTVTYICGVFYFS